MSHVHIDLNSNEEIIDTDPDLYAVSWCGTLFKDYNENTISKRYENHDMKISGDRNRIFKLWEAHIGHPSLRLLDGAEQILEQRRKLNI